MRLRIVIGLVLVLALAGCATAAPAPTATAPPAAVESATVAPSETAEATATVAPAATDTATAAPATEVTETTASEPTEVSEATVAPETTAESEAATVAPTISVAEAATVAPTQISAGDPSVTVEDQAIVGGTVLIARVVSQGPGWMVIHADQGGSPGPVIGNAPLFDGVNEDVAVQINVSMATATLYAMLHTDAEPVGKYEFPGADVPVQLNGAMVSPPFAVTGGLAAAPEGTAVAQATTAPTAVVAEATAAPAATAAETVTGTATVVATTPAIAATVVLTGDPAAGMALASQVGCTNCHSADGTAGVGPTWKGLFGSVVELHQGINVTADEAYLHQSIVNPSSQIVDGFPEEGRMPSFAGRLTEQQIGDLIAYIKTLR